MRERGVSSIAGGRQNKTRKPTCNAAKCSFLIPLMDIALLAKRNFQKILDSIWQSEKALNRVEEE